MSEPAHTVTAEGTNLAEAIHKAAAELGVPASHVQYKFDLAHFRSASGRAIGVDTVRVIAWAGEPAAAPAHAPVSEPAAAATGRQWLAGLLEKMGMKGEISSHVSRTEDKACELRITSEDARFLVGRQGATIQAIQELLIAAMAQAEPEWRWRVEVDGGRREERGERRDRDDRGGDRRDRRDRDDRGGDRREGRRDDRRDRGERRDRDDRGGDRGGDRGRRSDQDVEKLRRLAVRLAEEVRRTGESTEIHRELNSYERRIVHMAVSEIEGVYSESVGDGPVKQIRILPAREDAAAQGGGDDTQS